MVSSAGFIPSRPFGFLSSFMSSFPSGWEGAQCFPPQHTPFFLQVSAASLPGMDLQKTERLPLQKVHRQPPAAPLTFGRALRRKDPPAALGAVRFVHLLQQPREKAIEISHEINWLRSVAQLKKKNSKFPSVNSGSHMGTGCKPVLLCRQLSRVQEVAVLHGFWRCGLAWRVLVASA